MAEFYHMDHRRIESNHQKNNNFSTDLSFLPDNGLVELVWENGQITMQGQSSKSRKTSDYDYFPSYNLPSNTVKSRDKNGKFGSRTDCIMNDFPLSVPSNEMGLSQDDDMVPWLNYHIDDSLHQDYCSDFLTGLSGITENGLCSSQNNFPSIDKIKNSHSLSVNNGVSKVVDSEVYKPKTGQLYPLSTPQSQTPFPTYKPRAFDTSGAVCEDLSGIQASSNDFSSSKMPNQNPGRPVSSSNIMNFSHFSRPAAVIKAKDKVPVSIPENPVKLTLVGPNKSLKHNIQQVMEPIKSSMDKSINESLGTQDVEKSHAIRDVDVSKVDKIQSRDVEKIIEPVVASSVCSASSVDKASNYTTMNVLKRKSRDTEKSDPSDDVEEESVGAKNPSLTRGGSGSKRSRAAEVHNLSERRRRDRINEKMRALQELVPNCNKVDKASMLDEAIEYLKTLQLQVQIMSMGAGMYMPPMMQHMRAAHMAHFSHMGMGMGMVDVNGGSLGYPIMQAPPMQHPHYMVPPVSGSSSFHGQPISGPNFHQMAGSYGHMFGLVSQGLAMAPQSAGPVRNLNSINTNSQVMQNADANNLMMSRQAPNNEAFEQPALVLKHDQAADANGRASGTTR